MLKKRYGTFNNRCFSSKLASPIKSSLKPHSSKLHINNRGQVTVFIILGILLLLALAIILAIKTEIVTFKPEEAATTEKGRVESYLTSCINQLGNEAVELVGLQGGYIEVPSGISGDPDRHLKISPMNVIPFWAYGLNKNIPSLDQIKEQIDSYIEDNMRECLFSQQPFQETYDIIEKSELAADTEIVESKIIFNVHWDLEVRDKSGEVISELINHVAESPIKLKRVYDTAVQIVEREMIEMKIEDLTQDLIAIGHPSVPSTGLELSCSKKEWDVVEAKTTLQDLLRINLRQLQIKGTEVVEFPEELSYYQYHYVWDLGEEFVKPNVDATFIYDNNYPFTFQVYPVQGGKMSSGMMGGQDFISYLCIQSWKFTYDISYPIMVRVRDETTGYNFNIAFTVHLLNNIPNRKAEIIPQLPQATSFVSDTEFCHNKRIPMTVLTWELVDNTKETYYREPLDDVNILFTCLRHQCTMGQTEFDFARTGYQAGNIYDFPYCVGAILRGEKESYKDDWIRIVTKNDDTAELNLVPTLKVPLDKFKIVKHELDEAEAAGSLTENTGTLLSSSEIASITLTFEKNDTNSQLLGEPFHQSRFIASEKLDANVLKMQKAEFLAKADFTYALEVQVLDKETYLGGYKGQWLVSWDELENAEEIVIHVITTDAGASDEEKFGLLSQLEEKSKLVSQPKIK